MNRLNLVLGQGIPRATAPKVSGMMEVIAPEDGFFLETRLPLSRHNGLGWTDARKEQKNKQNGRLHVFEPKEGVVLLVFPSKTFAILRRNTLTRIAKKRNPKTSARLHDRIEEAAENHNDEVLKTDLPRLNHEISITEAKAESEVNDEKENKSKNVEKVASSEVSTDVQEECVDKDNDDEKPSDSSDDDDNEQSNNEVQKRTAPLELMGEFLKAIMAQNYSLAKKLCQMILIYEPENPEAKQFLPLIEQKLALETEHSDEESEETGEGSSDDSEENTSSTDNSETDSEASSEDSEDKD